MKIWKQKLKVTDVQKILVPEGTEILSIAVQNGEICIWEKVPSNFFWSPEAMFEERLIDIFGTGNPMEDYEGRFIGTVQLNGFVWHVFERARTSV